MNPTRPLSDIPPGEILAEEILKPLGITADTALRLGRFFDTSPQFWLNLQARYDLQIQARKLAGRLDREVKPLVRT